MTSDHEAYFPNPTPYIRVETYNFYQSPNSNHEKNVTYREFFLQKLSSSSKSPLCLAMSSSKNTKMRLKLNQNSSCKLLPVFYFWLLIASNWPLSWVVDAWDPNEHQINTKETTFYLSEGTLVKKLVFDLAETMDWRSMPYQYSMDQSSHFDISNEGKVTLVKRIDYEKTPREEFTVSVFNTETNIQEYYVNVIAEVFDENEAAPVFTEPSQDTFSFSDVPEIGTLITTVEASDKDRGANRLEFSIDNDLFHVDRFSGVITVAKSLEKYSSQHLDGQSSSNRVSFPLIVTVSDGLYETKKMLKIQVSLAKYIYQSEAISAEAVTGNPKFPKIYTRNTSENDFGTYMMASLQTPEVMIVIALVGVLAIVVLVACITAMVCISKPSRFAPNGIAPNRVYYYGSGSNTSQPPSTTNSQNITQSLYIYGDGGRLNNNRLDMRGYMRP